VNKALGTEPSIEGEFEMEPDGFDRLIRRIEEEHSDSIHEIRQMVFREQLITTSFIGRG